MAVRLCFPLITTLCIFATWPVYAPVPNAEIVGTLEEPQPSVQFKPFADTTAYTIRGDIALKSLERVEPIKESEVIETIDTIGKNWLLADVRWLLFGFVGSHIEQIAADAQSLLSSNLTQNDKSFLVKSIRVTLRSSAEHKNVNLEVHVPVKLVGHVKVGPITFPRVIYQTLVVAVPFGHIASDLKTIRNTLAADGKTISDLNSPTTIPHLLRTIRSTIHTSFRNGAEAKGRIQFNVKGWQITIDGSKIEMYRSPIRLQGKLATTSSEGASQAAVFIIPRTRGKYPIGEAPLWLTNDHPYEEHFIESYDYQGQVTVAPDGQVQVELYSYGGRELYWKGRSWFSLARREVWHNEVKSELQLTGNNCGSGFQ